MIAQYKVEYGSVNLQDNSPHMKYIRRLTIVPLTTFIGTLNGQVIEEPTVVKIVLVMYMY